MREENALLPPLKSMPCSMAIVGLWAQLCDVTSCSSLRAGKLSKRTEAEPCALVPGVQNPSIPPFSFIPNNSSYLSV